MPIYCGNNALNPDLVSGRAIQGTRRQCLRKGIGTGRRLPYDKNYLGPYQPIDNVKVYCGDKQDLPHGYDRFGNNPTCLQKGIAIGKKQRVLIGQKKTINKYIIFILVLLTVEISLYYLIVYIKPSFLLNDDKTDIDSKKITTFFILVSIPIFIIFYYNK